MGFSLKTDLIRFYGVLSLFQCDTLIDTQGKIGY